MSIPRKHFRQMIDLSTAHLSPAAKAFLDRGRNATGQQCLQMVEEDAEEPTRLLVMFSHEHYWLDGGGNSIVAVPHQYGWFVYAHEEFCGDDVEEIPPELVTIIFACNKAGAHWINFDADADVCDGFPTFDDEEENDMRNAEARIQELLEANNRLVDEKRSLQAALDKASKTPPDATIADLTEQAHRLMRERDDLKAALLEAQKLTVPDPVAHVAHDAMAVWEEVLEIIANETARHRGYFAAKRDGIGSGQMRDDCIKVGRFCDRVFHRAQEIVEDDDCFDGVAYDFEIVPAIVDYLARADEWDDVVANARQDQRVDTVAVYLLCRFAEDKDLSLKLAAAWAAP